MPVFFVAIHTAHTHDGHKKIRALTCFGFALVKSSGERFGLVSSFCVLPNEQRCEGGSLVSLPSNLGRLIFAIASVEHAARTEEYHCLRRPL